MMFLLLQFTAFDYRLYQAPELLVPPLRAWQYARPDKDFISHFGKVKESYRSVLAPHLLREDNHYADAESALKFMELETGDLPFSIKGKMRRICPDGRGGLKFLIGLNFNLEKDIAFNSLEESIAYFCSLGVEIMVPPEGNKHMDLLMAGPSLKNRYIAGSTKSKQADSMSHLVREGRTLLMLDLSERERKHFQDLGSYQEFGFPDGLSISYKKNVVLGQQIDTFLTHNVHLHELNRLVKYRISNFWMNMENASAMLYFSSMGNDLSPKALNELRSIREILSGKLPLEGWLQALTMIRELFPQDIQHIVSEIDAHIDLEKADSQADAKEVLKKQTSQMIRRADLAGCFLLIHQNEQILTPNDRTKFYELEFQFNNLQRAFDQNQIREDYKGREESRISSAILNLLRDL